MKAARYHGRGDIRVEDVPEPRVGPGQVKVAVQWCGICGTDLHEYLDGPIFCPPTGAPHALTGEQMPVVLGHECAGVDSALGQAVQCTAAGGTVVNVAIWGHPATVEMNNLVFNEVNVVGSLAYCDDHEPTIALLRDGKVDARQFITGEIALDDIVAGGFRELIDNKDANVKILVHP